MSGPRRRRVRGRGSIEHLGGERYRVRIRGRVPDGRPIRHLDTVVRGRAEAERVLEGFRRQCHDLEAGLVPLEERVTLARYLERARRASGAGRSLVWTPRDQSVWSRMLRPLWNLHLQDLDADRLGGWMERLEQAGYAGNTRRSAWVLLRRILGHALATKTLVRLPWGDARLALVPESECAHGEPLEDDEWLRVREAAARLDASGRGGPLSDLWLRLCVQRMAASRPVELCQVGPDDLVPDAPNGPMLRISAAVVAKGGAPGLRTLGPFLLRRIEAHLSAMPEDARRLGLLFPTRKGRRWAPRWAMDHKGYRVGRDWITETELAHLRAESGCPRFRPYALRHTRLTESAAQGGFTAAQAQGGHRQHRTVQRYVHSAARHLTTELFDESPVLSEPTPPLPSDLPAHEGPAIDGPQLGAEPGGRLPGMASDDDLADACDYAAAVVLHGAEGAAVRIVASLGPLDAYALAGELARVVLDPRIRAAHEAPLVALVAQLRAHARLAATKPTPQTDTFGNDAERLGRISDSCFT